MATPRLGGQPDLRIAIIDVDTGDAVDSFALVGSKALAVAIVDGSGNQVTSFGGSGGTSATDDAAFTVASGSGTPMMGVVTADSVDSGDAGVIGMLANRQQKMTLYDSSGVEVTSFGGGTQYTEDAASTANPVGPMSMARRRDTLTALEVTADDDNIALNATSKGELYVKQSDAVALAAGAALVGKVGIDQTTPGTTNAVAATNLPTTVDTNSGNKSASTLRVVLATDQPQLTNKLLVTPDANSAVNVAQMNGVAVTMGTGVTGTGVQRTTLATNVALPLSSTLNSWAASSNLTVTNLHSLAASATFIAGWQSAVIDLSAATDARITAKLTGTSSNNQAGTMFMYLVGLLDDSNWPAGAGTGEGTLTPTGGASIIGAVFRPAAVSVGDNSAGRIYYLDCPSVRAVFNGNPIKKVVIYITGNIATSTNAQFAASGNQVTVVTSYGTLGA